MPCGKKKQKNKGSSCDDALKLFPEQILLPNKLKTYPPMDVDSLDPMNPRWVHKALMAQYLSDMCRRLCPNQCRIEESNNDFIEIIRRIHIPGYEKA
jgi:hypothetical protein